jgi:predicted amidohydrolase YtcJ
VTTAQNGLAERLYVTALSVVSRAGLLPLRVVVWPDDEVGREMVEGSFNPGIHNTRRFEVGAVKLIADGSIQGYTGYLSEHYHVPPSPGEPDYRGYPVIPRDELVEQVAYFHRAGLQIAVHGNGDAAIDDILYAFERAQAAFPREDARHVIIHAQMARDDQLDRMKALGVIPSFFPLHTYYWGDRHMNIFMGPERARRMSPARSAIDRDLRFTIHSDTPVVPMDPLLLVWSAVNRISFKGTSIGEDQRITPMRALRAVTIDAAWQMFLDDTRGSIEAGKFADLVILSGDPLDNPEGIRDLKVLETIVGGRTVYKAE